MSRFTSVEEVLSSLQSRFDSRNAGGRPAAVRLECRGAGGGSWRAVVSEGRLEITRGPGEQTDLVIRCTTRDWLDVANGRLDPAIALVTGRITLTGGLAGLARLRTLFDL